MTMPKCPSMMSWEEEEALLEALKLGAILIGIGGRPANGPALMKTLICSCSRTADVARS
jgi:hypothetical protein